VCQGRSNAAEQIEDQELNMTKSVFNLYFASSLCVNTPTQEDDSSILLFPPPARPGIVFRTKRSSHMAEEQLTIEAQEAINELWAEQVIPFKPEAHKVEAGGESGRYTIHFFDSRLSSLFIYWNPEKESFKTAVREVGKNTVGKRSRAKGAGLNLSTM
jgi:hypothetical protein